MGGADASAPAPPNFDEDTSRPPASSMDAPIGVVPAGKTALQVAEEEAELMRQQAIKAKEHAEKEAEAVRRAAEQARIAAEEEVCFC